MLLYLRLLALLLILRRQIGLVKKPIMNSLVSNFFVSILYSTLLAPVTNYI